MRKFILIFTLFLCGCGDHVPESEKPKDQPHLNLIICTDFSNRITKYNDKPVRDEVLISNFLEMYYPSIYRSNERRRGQEDIIRTYLLNKKNIKKYGVVDSVLKIDLTNSRFNNMERIDYLIGQDSSGQFRKDKDAFLQETVKLYKKLKEAPQGADMISLFKYKINTSIIEGDNYRNILILFTDGYIEYNMYKREGNKFYQFGEATVSAFRKAYESSGYADIEKFFHDNNYGIKPVSNPKLKSLEVLAIEFYDRSLSSPSSVAKNEHTDYEIMKLFWEDWMAKSGVKRFESYEVFTGVNQFRDKLLEFIKNK